MPLAVHVQLSARFYRFCQLRQIPCRRKLVEYLGSTGSRRFHGFNVEGLATWQLGTATLLKATWPPSKSKKSTQVLQVLFAIRKLKVRKDVSSISVSSARRRALKSGSHWSLQGFNQIP